MPLLSDKIKSKVPFKPSNFLVVNNANPCDHHEPDAKILCEIPNCVDFY